MLHDTSHLILALGWRVSASALPLPDEAAGVEPLEAQPAHAEARAVSVQVDAVLRAGTAHTLQTSAAAVAAHRQTEEGAAHAARGGVDLALHL